MRWFERLAWWFIWSTHWVGWHQTYKTLPDAGVKGHVWCADCLKWKKE